MQFYVIGGEGLLLILYLIPQRTSLWGTVFNRRGLLLTLKCVLFGPVLIVKLVQTAFTIIVGLGGLVLGGITFTVTGLNFFSNYQLHCLTVDIFYSFWWYCVIEDQTPN